MVPCPVHGAWDSASTLVAVAECMWTGGSEGTGSWEDRFRPARQLECMPTECRLYHVAVGGSLRGWATFDLSKKSDWRRGGGVFAIPSTVH